MLQNTVKTLQNTSLQITDSLKKILEYITS